MSIQTRFEKFHEENPHVYEELVKLARVAKERGRARFSIDMIYQVVRWNRFIQTNDPAFKLNDHYRSRYARLIMDQEKDLSGMFEIRELKS